MNLREPKKKQRVKLKEQLPFPIILGDKNEWVTYTAHLTELGSCIIEPSEITAVHSMVIINSEYDLCIVYTITVFVIVNFVYVGFLRKRFVITWISFVWKSTLWSTASY